MPREQSRGCLADLWNAECVDKPVERYAPPPVDRADQVRRTQFAPAFAADKLLGLQPEDIAGPTDEAVFPEGGDVLGAHAFDVEAVARHEMLEPLHRLRRADETTRAAPRRHARLAYREAVTDGTFVRKLIGHRVPRPLVQHNRDDLGNHIAGTLNNDGVPFSNVFSRDLVFVVERGSLNHHAADRNGHEKG